MKFEDLKRTPSKLSDIPDEEGFRCSIILYKDNQQVEVEVVKEAAGKFKLRNLSTGEWLFKRGSGIVWNSCKGWRTAQ